MPIAIDKFYILRIDIISQCRYYLKSETGATSPVTPEAVEDLSYPLSVLGGAGILCAPRNPGGTVVGRRRRRVRTGAMRRYSVTLTADFENEEEGQSIEVDAIVFLGCLVRGEAHITHLEMQNDDTDETFDMEVSAEMLDQLSTGGPP